jgi:hypothetical protein
MFSVVHLALFYNLTWLICVLIVVNSMLSHFCNSMLNLSTNFSAAVSCFSVDDPSRNHACIIQPFESVAFLELDVTTCSADIFSFSLRSVKCHDEPESTKIRKTTSNRDWRSWHL